MVTIMDRDLKAALRFMITIATILEEMIRDFIEFPDRKVNYEKYQKRIKKYRPTFDGIMTDFEDSVFGIFYNSRMKETFIRIMSNQGWKYF